VCCSVLQCVAVCCSVSTSSSHALLSEGLTAVCCSVLQCVAVCCSVSTSSSHALLSEGLTGLTLAPYVYLLWHLMLFSLLRHLVFGSLVLLGHLLLASWNPRGLTWAPSVYLLGYLILSSLLGHLMFGFLVLLGHLLLASNNPRRLTWAPYVSLFSLWDYWARYMVAKTHKVPYLHRSFSAKQPYN